jgi:MFS family permease
MDDDSSRELNGDWTNSGGQGFKLLRSNAYFRRLWSARAVSVVGDSLGGVALILLVAERKGTGAAVGLLLFAGDFVPTLFSPFAGVVADRSDQRQLMVGLEFAQGLIMGAIVLFMPSLPILLLLVASRSILSTVFQPAARSAVPRVVDDNQLESANALMGAGTHGLDSAGPLVAAALLPLLGVRGVLAIDTLTFLVAGLLLLRLPQIPPELSMKTERSTVLTDVAAGLRYLWRDRTLRAIAIGFFGLVAFSAIDDVALVFLAQQDLGAGEAGASLLYAASGLGLLIGFALLSRKSLRARLASVVVFGFAVSGSGNLLTAAAPVLAIAFAMQFVRGLGISLVEVGNNTLIQRSVPIAMRGRVFANLYGVIGVATGVAYLAGGPLLDATSPRAALVVAGAGALLATLATVLMLLRNSSSRA